MARILKISPDPPEGDQPPDSEQRESARRAPAAWMALGAVFVALVVLASPWPGAGLPRAESGATWTGPVVTAPFEITVNDPDLARRWRRMIEESHPRVFVWDQAAEGTARTRLERLLALAAETPVTPEGTSGLPRLAADRLGIRIDTAAAAVLAREARRDDLKTKLDGALRGFYSGRGISADKALFVSALRDRRLRVASPEGTLATTHPVALLSYPVETQAYLEALVVPSLGLSVDVSAVCVPILDQLLQPNLVFSPEMTLRNKMAALAGVSSKLTILRGDPVIVPGELVGPFQVAMLDEVRVAQRGKAVRQWCGNALLLAVLMGFAALYLMRYQAAEVAFRARDILMVGSAPLLVLALGRAIDAAPPLDAGLGPFGYPSAFVGMLFVLVFNPRMAMFLTVLTAIAGGLQENLDFSFVQAAVIGGFTGIAALTRATERQQILFAGLWVALANVAVATGETLARGLDLAPSLDLLGAAVANGIACYALVMAALPALEKVFRITTAWRLMELTSMSHPLLREMEERVPGSFQHVLNVTKLAESAAEAVGANVLLVRAGAYFHDIGKMEKPKYFTENQARPEERRIHSRLSPVMSAHIIRKHVKDGLRIAARYKLPERVADFIPQHHGTSLIKYFYNQARATARPNEVVPEDEFRYPGPMPQTIEAAIVMIADSVEATATAKLSGKIVREEEVRQIVNDTVNDKFYDHQFDECRMTFADLDKIKKALIRSLLSRYHQRVDYPKFEKRDVKDITTVEPPAPPAPVAPVAAGGQ